MNISCIVDVASREVSFQENYKIASYDHNVDVIHFSVEPIEDFSLDLSSIRIAAQGPDNVRHDYAVDPSTVQIEEETGYITFDWPIPQGVTEMPIGTFKYGDKGRLIFAVCAEIISGDTVSKAWHSDDGIITVVAHLEPEAGGGEDPSETATNAQKIAQLQTDVAVINTQVGALGNGSPAPVETIAEMTDESAVYLYTGSETGYTAGNWYFWNGSAWTSGGTYGGAVTSTTFDKHGVPADDFAVGEALAEKADSTDVTALDTRVSDLEADLNDVNEWLGYSKNLFNGIFSTTNASNWSVVQNRNDVTFTHLSQYTTGIPATAILDLAEGTYTFSANYNGETNALSLYNGTSYVRVLAENDSITVQSGDAPILKLALTPAQGNSVTISDIFIGSNSNDGVITQLSNDINQLSETTGVLSAEVDDLQDGFDDISEPVIGELASSETIINKTINSSGALITAGTDKYRIDKYSVTSGKKYYISGSANWSNLNWCFYKSDDSVAQLGDASASGATLTTITNKEISAPASADYLLITYNTDSVVAVCKTQTGYKLNGKWKGKKWVCVGDSLTAENTRTTKHYFDYVAEETGITTVNMGDSGSGYAREQDVDTAFYQRISDCPTDADVVTIFGSFNDLGAGLSLGSVNDTGTTTLAGCINTTIDNLQTVIPLVNLGIVAPTPWDTTQPSTSGNAYNYVEMLKAICARRSIPFLDLWRESNLRPWDADFRELAYSKDGGSGTHPDENGHKLIAPRFKAFLETLLM